MRFPRLSFLYILPVILAVVFLVISCQESFTLEELVDGPDGKALSISPTSAVLQIGDNLPVDTSGGIPPYSYGLVSGDGSFTGNIFSAPASPGLTVIRVRDQAGTSVYGEFTINNPGLVLGISPASQTVYTGDDINFSPVGGTGPFSFEVTTNESFSPSAPASGVSSYSYTAGPSDGSNVVTDIITVTDSLGDSAAATISVQAKPLSISPEIITVYVNQSIIFSAVGGDGAFSFAFMVPAHNQSGGSLADNVYTAGPTPGTDTVTLTDGYDGRTRPATVTVVDSATNVDYEAGEILNIVSAAILTGSTFDAEFTIINHGTADGSRDISWTVYASTDTSIGGADDRIVASGSISGGLPTGPGTTVQLSDGTGGTWPSEPGDYYLLVEVSAADDLETGDNRNRSAGSTEIVAPLSISPAVASVYVGQSIDFEISGGRGGGTYSYSFSQSDSGSPSMTGDSYTAGNSAGTDILEVTDNAYGWSDQTTITVSEFPPPPAGDIEYIVDSFTAVDPTPDAGSAMGESFTLLNDGLDDGGASVNWTAWVSQDNSPGLSGGDSIIDSGSESALVGGDSADVSLAGFWPATAGTWYLKVREWSDDEVTPDEWFVSPAFNVQPVSAGSDVDYYVSLAPSGGSAQVGDTVSASFTARNQGTDAGSSPVEWSAYISADQVYNTGDILVDSGSFSALGSEASSASIPINEGSWPAAGNWYLLVRLQAADEVNTSNNIRASSSTYNVTDPGASDPDYKVSDISMYAPYVTSGSPVEESFSIANIGTSGSENVTWTAYASLNVVPDAGEEIGSGTVGPLNGGQTLSTIPTLGAVWPLTPGEYYLIIEVSASDEVNTDDYAVSAGRFTVSDPPDYEIQSVTFPLEAEVGTPITGGFAVENSGSGEGRKNISWEAFLSFDTGFSDDDLDIGSGSESPLDAGDSFPIHAEDLDISSWPAYGRCYLLLRISASDDGAPSNNAYISAPVELFVYDIEGPVPGGTANDGSGPSTGPIADTQHIGTLRPGQTLVVRGWLDSSNPLSSSWDTYAVTLASGVTTISSYALWSAADDIGELHIWDESNFEAASAITFNGREPNVGWLSVSGWIPSETGYVGFRSYRAVSSGDEYPYTIYIKGGN
ncbi:hypothetical protein [Marispirochaeta aestuarii]|uniref:hypothetical protein n=1 Tax=Marispirochaeta aestuarii TaxID=1963862 RepID=UPI002ABDAA29|nr:hypothetical protein [Marispirochaeta aestuarii]